MPFSGGVWTAPANSWNPAVTGTAINATDWAAQLADLATALTTCVLKDGSQTITANLPMGGYKLTGLAVGSTNGDSVRYEQVMLLAGGTMTGTLVIPDNKLNVVGNADATKIINFSAASITAGNTRTLHDAGCERHATLFWRSIGNASFRYTNKLHWASASRNDRNHGKQQRHAYAHRMHDISYFCIEI